ncbi:MAG: glycosyltransferase family 39 protein [Lachnospiraceae bacterium]|nr:glycosyltransferase family 39 protein [Lachnospiraceae bacterium]
MVIPVALYEALFIKLFGTAAVMSLKIANIFFMTGSVALVMAIADKMFGKKAGMICGLMYAIYPAPIMLTSVLTSQHQEVFFFLLAVYFLLAFKSKIKYLSYVLAGISITLSQFFRPEGIIFFAVVVACIIWKLIASIYEFRKSRDEKKRDVLVKEIKNLIIASALIFGVYFVLYSGMNLVVKCSGLNDEGLVNYIPETKFLMGMDADTNGYYTDEYGYIGEIDDKVERKEAFTNALKENFDRYPGFLSFEIDKFNQFWSSYEDPYWSMGSIEGVDGLIDAAYTWIGIERGVTVAIWLLFVVACIITIKKKNYRIGDGSHLLKMSNRQEAIEKHR